MRWIVALTALLAMIGGERAVAAAPAPAAGGEQIVLVRARALLLRDASGEERPLLRTPAFTFPRYPAWSPDGRSLAYVLQVLPGARPDGDYGDDLMLADADGGNQRIVLAHDTRGAELIGLAWAPDGDALYVGYQRLRVENGRFLEQVQRVERVDLASGARTVVADGALAPSIARAGQLAYLRQDSEGNGGIVVSALDGSGARVVVALGGDFLFLFAPRIAPDGATIAFAAADGFGARPVALPHARVAAHGLPLDIWTARVSDGKRTRLTLLFEDDPFPAWSADGATLTILGANGLYRVDADGGNLRTIGEGWAGGQLDAR